ncbi:vancomycin aglycone glucosyltransferase [Archangium gephyra]|uniref:Glycosyltransferase n=2 Tax=Archangium gephyra TaxID=48 RepID=A0AAC8TAQ4_9BACT|nr:Putative glycosyltransferase [Archangium gephyra]REG30900.1 vancomycin aglycone glucosyltransferase [Archangium gephyra]
MLALATALRDAGHEVLLGATPTFASEAAALGVPFAPVGVDFQRMLAEHRAQLDHDNPLAAIRLMNRVMPEVIRAEWHSLLPLLPGQQLVVAGGAALSARSAVESVRLPFRYVAYTPQLLPSAWHPPFMIPLTRTPRWFNRLGWWGMGAVYDRLLLPVLNELRRGQGLPALTDVIRQAFPSEPGMVLLAADPELAPAPPDLSVHQVGAFHLADPRPLPAEAERFLAEGEPPVYIGFGSMPDAAPERTSLLLAEAARRAGCRALLSSGWAGLGEGSLGSHVQVVGPLSHGALFPRLAGIVHHGGAGTTAASTRAGVPQLVVPHMLDQFMNARYVHTAGIGLSLSRNRLGVERLASALLRLREDPALRARAAHVGERVRARNSLAAAVALLEQAAREGLTPRPSPSLPT